jgi:hypothetical protein
MSTKARVMGFVFIGALVGALVMVVGAPNAEAQMSDLSGGSQQDETMITPGFINFCTGNRCPGQTCDEVNDMCVGSVTLQQPAGAPLIGLTEVQLDRFNKGKTAFEKTFQDVIGLGPVFNQDGCASCHSTPVGGSGTITVVRFGVLDGNNFDPLADLGGSLWNRESISPECAEIIPVPPTNHAAERLTNSTLGFGLVEAIKDEDIEFNAINPPAGVSGRVTIVPLLEDPPQTRIGRFGWKNQLGTVESFTADAMLQEMGITSRIFPEDNAPNNDPILLAACDTVADPEDVPDSEGVEFLDRATDFQRFLAPPPQTPRSGMTGEAIFDTIGCADCHVGTFIASDHGSIEKPIRGTTLHPYSDFLIHDAGSNGDFIEQGGAQITELRTTPLWGLRIRDPLWHDGRVAGGTFDFRIKGAIQQHNASGSEAQASAQAFQSLSSADQDALVAFMDSLGRREFDMNGDGLVDDADVIIINALCLNTDLITPDDLCAIADADQNGVVSDADLELLDVALGIADPDDEDPDEFVDDVNMSDVVEANERDSGALQGLAPTSGGPVMNPDGELVEEDESRGTRPQRRGRISRRGP